MKRYTMGDEDALDAIERGLHQARERSLVITKVLGTAVDAIATLRIEVRRLRHERTWARSFEDEVLGLFAGVDMDEQPESGAEDFTLDVAAVRKLFKSVKDLREARGEGQGGG